MQEGTTRLPGAPGGGGHVPDEGACPASLEEAAQGETACASSRGELSCLGLHTATVRAGGSSLWGGDRQWATPSNVSAWSLPLRLRTPKSVSVCPSPHLLPLPSPPPSPLTSSLSPYLLPLPSPPPSPLTSSRQLPDGTVVAAGGAQQS